MSLRHASFFSGVGGLDQGFERAGIETVSLCEFDPYASAVLAERFPGVPNLGDITKIKKEDVHEADIWSGGFPCQDLSVAGARRGFTDGTRSSLAFRFLDLVEEGRRPRWLVLENVPGLFSSNGGRDFSRLLREVVGLGYGVAWRTLDARHFGVAQRRRRVFIVAALNEAFGGLGADRAAEVLFECAGGCGHLEASGTKGEGSPGGSGGGVEVVGTIGAGLAKRTGTTQDPHLVGWGDRTFGADISNTIPARYHKGINTTVEPGHLVGSETHADGVREVDGVARRVDDSQRVEGSEVSHQVVPAYGEELADGLNARDWKAGVGNQDIGRKGFLAIQTYSIREDAKAKDSMVYGAYGEDTADTLQARDKRHDIGNQDIGRKGFLAITTPVKFVINDTRPVLKTENGSGYSEKDLAYTLTRVDQQGVVLDRPEVEEGLLSFPSRFGSNADVTEDITQSFAHSAGAPAVMRVGASYDGLNQKMESDGAHRTIRVGRDSSDFVVAEAGVEDDPLLPQGLDSHRYRVAGNGVVAPVAEFIGRRLVGVDTKWFKKEVEG